MPNYYVTKITDQKHACNIVNSTILATGHVKLVKWDFCAMFDQFFVGCPSCCFEGLT